MSWRPHAQRGRTPLANAEAIRRFAELPRAVIESYGDEGDVAKRYLLNPVIFATLGDVAGTTVVDAGCGTGYLARLLARRGATVIGIEPTPPLIDYAREREAAISKSANDYRLFGIVL